MNINEYKDEFQDGAILWFRRKKWIDEYKSKIQFHQNLLYTGFPSIPCHACDKKMALKAVIDFTYDSLVLDIMCLNGHKITLKVRV